MESNKVAFMLIFAIVGGLMVYLQIQTHNQVAVTITSTIIEKDYNYAGDGIFFWWFHMANGDWTQTSNADYYRYNIGDNYTYIKYV